LMRARTCWNVESGPTSGTNCFGMLSRETGHNRVPAPPHMITGTIRDDGIGPKSCNALTLQTVLAANVKLTVVSC
jgi:hypothetical protein